jgi:hypothetical protein
MVSVVTGAPGGPPSPRRPEVEMADPNQPAAESRPPLPSDAVASSAGASYWSVSGCGWGAVGPGLPPEYAALLAPPIVVGATTCPAGPPSACPAAVGPAPAGQLPAGPAAAGPLPAGPAEVVSPERVDRP